MKKLALGVVSVMLIASQSAVFAEMPSQKHAHSGGAMMSGEYCEKHCRTTDLKKEVKALEERLQKEKAAGKPTGGKVIEMQAKAKETREHLAKHEKELQDAKAELEKTEQELTALEGK